MLILATYPFSSCVNDDFDDIIRSENGFARPPYLPVPGSGGIISVSTITDDGLQLSWAKATDRLTPQAELEYRAFSSGTGNISTPDDAESNGTPLDGWLKDTAILAPAGLLPQTTYYINVIVRASDGRKSAYITIMVTTLGTVYLYSTGPLAGNLTANTGAAARADIDAKCSPVPGTTGFHALISISDSDEIRDFPSLYGLPVSWPVRSTGKNRVAMNWDDLLNGSIDLSLVDAGISDSSWWSGSLNDGSIVAGKNCDGWKSNAGTEGGWTGVHDSFDYPWINNGSIQCNIAQRILCIAW